MRDFNWHLFVNRGRTAELTKHDSFAIKTTESLSFINKILSVYSESLFMDNLPLINLITYTWGKNWINFSAHFIKNLHGYYTSLPWQIRETFPYWRWVSSDSRQLCSKLRWSWEKTLREQLFMSRCVSLCYLFAIHQGLTTSTGWKEIALSQCRWDRTGRDSRRIHAMVFNAEAGKRTFPQEYTIYAFMCRRGKNKNLHLRDA